MEKSTSSKDELDLMKEMEILSSSSSYKKAVGQQISWYDLSIQAVSQ